MASKEELNPKEAKSKGTNFIGQIQKLLQTKRFKGL